MAAGTSQDPVTQADIVAGLHTLGLKAGDGLMVHSSLSSFGQVAGGAPAVIAALMEVLTPEGTLLLPSFNHGSAFREGAPGYYHPEETPTTNGKIPDTFWRMEGVYRSLNPTHPYAAWGKHARRYTEFHHRTLSMGPESPLGLLYADDGYCLLLGVDYLANTFHHIVEAVLQTPCIGLRTGAYPVHLPDGRQVVGRTWSYRAQSCPLTDLNRYHDVIEARGLHRQVVVGKSPWTLYRLRDGFEVIAEVLQNGKDGFPPCSRCPIRPVVNEWSIESDWDEERQELRPESEAWSY